MNVPAEVNDLSTSIPPLVRQMLDALPGEACVICADTTIVAWNHAMAASSGVSANQALGSRLIDVLSTASEAVVVQRLLQLQESGGAVSLSDAGASHVAPVAPRGLCARLISREPMLFLVTLPGTPGQAPAAEDDESRAGPMSMWSEEEADLETCRLELRRVRAALHAASQAKDELLANVSAAVRNPIANIVGYANVLASEELRTHEQREFTQSLRRCSEQLFETVTTILGVAAIQSGKAPLHPDECEPWQLLTDAVKRLEGAAKRKGLVLAAEPIGQIPSRVCTDADKLSRVLDILVEHALRTTDVGGVRVMMRMEYPQSCSTPSLVVEVCDTSAGLTAQAAVALFHPFFGREPGASNRGAPTFDSLAEANELAKLLGGHITWAGSPAEGNTFTLTLRTGHPSAEAARASAARVEEPAAPGLQQILSPECLVQGRRILIVGGDVETLRLASFSLARAGAAVDTAASVGEAEKAIARAATAGLAYHLVLADTDGDGHGGSAMVSRHRAAGHAGPIVSMSTNPLAMSRGQAMLAGYAEHFLKPILRERLLNVCAGCLAPHIFGAQGCSTAV